VEASDCGRRWRAKTLNSSTYSRTKSELRLSVLDSRRRHCPWRARIFLWLIFSAPAFGAGLDHYPQLVVNDSGATARGGVRVTYLGTNGYQFEFKGHALLVDPYFSRVDLLSVALGSRIQPNASRIDDGLRHLAIKADAVLVTHGHFDHLLDVPAVMAKMRARLVASPSNIELARRAGASSGDAVKPGDVRRIGPWKIRVLSATHDRLFGTVPFDRPPSRAGSSAEASTNAGPPQRAADWICGEPLAFLIEANGQRIYIDSGGTPALLPPNERVDLAILGMALPDSRARLHAALERLHPRYILPSHQDDFFRPLSVGFQFGLLTDFPFVERECAQHNRSRLILLDYFKPWTLPAAINPKSQKPNPKRDLPRITRIQRMKSRTHPCYSSYRWSHKLFVETLRFLSGSWNLRFGISLDGDWDFARETE
jgi:L-ascorbate metabolism protein UlaG (beta-lactamase superfamily)